ncbi:MAG: enoyl-CoA hydratase/isomerase family protein [Rhodothermales bacterium]
MDLETLLYEIEGEIAVITINRPDKLNALNTTVIAELDQCFRQARSDRAVKGVILTGAGEKSFVAGADIQQFPDLDALQGHRFALRGQAVFTRIEDMPKPVVAAVNGFALGGGCELAMACHLRIASDNASFGQPEVNLGILPGYGGTQRLPRLVGRGIATELILTGARISAQRAYEIGLVNHVVPLADLLETAREMVATIASKAPLAVSMALEALRASDLPQHEGLRHEAALFGQVCASEDFKEGVAAFLERRKATFKGQ